MLDRAGLALDALVVEVGIRKEIRPLSSPTPMALVKAKVITASCVKCWGTGLGHHSVLAFDGHFTQAWGTTVSVSWTGMQVMSAHGMR